MRPFCFFFPAFALTGEDDEGGLVARGVGERPVWAGVFGVWLSIEYLVKNK